MAVTRWIFDTGGQKEYQFPRNPDRNGGDTYWAYEFRYNEIDVLGSMLPTVHVDGFRGARRTLRFTAITGTMMRTLQTFYFSRAVIRNCRDHLYGQTPPFNCLIASFTPAIHPTLGNSFPGSGEDTWDLEMTLIRVS